MPLVDTISWAVAFCSAPGHGQLDGSACAANPVIELNSPHTCEEFGFHPWAIGSSGLFVLSRWGDVHARNSGKDRLLGRPLENGVQVAPAAAALVQLERMEFERLAGSRSFLA